MRGRKVGGLVVAMFGRACDKRARHALLRSGDEVAVVCRYHQHFTRLESQCGNGNKQLLRVDLRVKPWAARDSLSDRV